MKEETQLKSQLLKRQKEAAQLARRLQSALEHVEKKVPSYDGKGPFMDRLIEIQRGVQGLATDLKMERDRLN